MLSLDECCTCTCKLHVCQNLLLHPVYYSGPAMYERGIKAYSSSVWMLARKAQQQDVLLELIGARIQTVRAPTCTPFNQIPACHMSACGSSFICKITSCRVFDYVNVGKSLLHLLDLSDSGCCGILERTATRKSITVCAGPGHKRQHVGKLHTQLGKD